jgi:hypothetical protein
MIRARALLLAALLAGGGSAIATGCSSSTSAGVSTSGACDPLTPPTITLGTVLGVGKDAQGTLYVADVAPGTGSPDGQDRVFVSSGSVLVRQHVTGTGESGSPPNASYTLSFQDPSEASSMVRALLIQQSAGQATSMALGPGDSKSFTGGTPLALLSASALTGLTLRNEPNVVQFVADVSNGDAIVVVAPMDPYGSGDFRLFYGPPAQMAQRTITSYGADCCGTSVVFQVGSASYTARFNLEPAEGGLGGTPGPSTLDTGSATLDVTVKTPTPQTLTGFSFSCP